MKISADVVRIRQKSPAGGAAVHVHLLFDGNTEILNKMKTVSYQQSLWCPLAGSLSVKATAIPADDFDFRMAAQPFCATLHVAVFQNIDNAMPLEIDDDCSEILRFQPAPVVNTDDPCRWSIGSASAEQLAKNRVVADPDAQSVQKTFSGSPACGMSQMTRNQRHS